jgi:hypothetical protein
MILKTLILFFFVGILLGCSGKGERKDQPGSRRMAKTESESTGFSKESESFSVSADSVISVYGIIQSSGLQQFDKPLVNADFQLISENHRFFLVTESELEDYWGKCVSVKGKLAEGWSLNTVEFEGKYAFGAIALKMDSIQLFPENRCFSFIWNQEKNEKLSYTESIQGLLVRHKRPAPDIAMDYAIISDIPVPHPQEPTYGMREIPVYIHISMDEINRLIENRVQIRTFGELKGGYAEYIVFVTDSIELIHKLNP